MSPSDISMTARSRDAL